MSLFEFLVYKLLGDPTHSDSDGVSYWNCPRCDKGGKHFRTLPPREGYKDRAYCHHCGLSEDIFGLMRLVRGVTNFPRERGTVSLWTAEYEGQFRHRRGGLGEHPLSSPRGPRSTEGTCRRCRLREEGYDPSCDLDKPEVVAVADEVDEAVGFARGRPVAGRCLNAIAIALRLAHDRGIHPHALAELIELREYSRKRDRDHMAECDDPDCDWYCCVESRAGETEPRTPDD